MPEPWRSVSLFGEPPAHVTRVANDGWGGRSVAECGETGCCDECGQVRRLWRWAKTPWASTPGKWVCFLDLDAVGGFTEVDVG